ncbi:MAG: PEP-CTERM sorting domain-containing protein [Pirellulales bacterium]
MDFYYKRPGIIESSAAQHLYIVPVPEPAAWLLAGLAGIAFAVQARRRCLP